MSWLRRLRQDLLIAEVVRAQSGATVTATRDYMGNDTVSIEFDAASFLHRLPSHREEVRVILAVGRVTPSYAGLATVEDY